MAHCAPKQTYTVFNLNNDRKLQHINATIEALSTPNRVQNEV